MTKGEQIAARVVQKYVEHPLLVSLPMKGIVNVKFDIRQWVLVKQFKPLRAYIFSHPYGRLCSKPYETVEWKDPSTGSAPPITSDTNNDTGPGESLMKDVYNVAVLLPFMTNNFGYGGEQVR